MFFDDEALEAKRNNATQTTTVLNNFTGSGSASASGSDYGNIASGLSDLKGAFSGGGSSSNAFNVLGGDSDAWDWFSSEVQNDLDTTQNRDPNLRGNSISSTPLLDEYYRVIREILDGDL